MKFSNALSVFDILRLIIPSLLLRSLRSFQTILKIRIYSNRFNYFLDYSAARVDEKFIKICTVILISSTDTSY